ncbi:TIR domain-containing protein [Ktedonospora formicarum]|uniref:TIR domain-containing protein n=1 Tax=Ktedonospora formicarum TaxID=2778364 RepID=A0A8J3I7P5_9CHLR|nr:TIR domain-containing protein [Ktedonospora formicarum]GHO48638.1 hypothetical protein KSX_68010 [Ktedonospora formicarum]
MLNRTQPEPVQLFYSYAHEDEALRTMLEKHLSLLHRQGLLAPWHDRKIQAGAEWKQEIDEHLNAATIILLLLSSDFLASDYCYEHEMQRAMERHERGEARVIPIILRPCSWQSAPFGSLQALPRNGQAITTWRNRDAAFLEVEQSLRALIEYHPSPTPVSRSTAKSRENMALRLQSMYHELLADSLQEAAWIELGLSMQPNAVQNATNLWLRQVTRPAHPLPPGTSISKVYQEANQELLLLGKPGTGKSTLLYQLGHDLLKEAIKHPRHPLPVLFPLSSWAQKRLPLQEWIVEQLASPLYEVPRKLSQQWVQDEQILPLLDGLDEMEETARPACIAAINTYRREHPLRPLVVCSRSNEYRTASKPERLRLQSAVEVQPLSPAQLEATLNQADKPFAPLRAALKANPALRELARTPLWLAVLLLMFRNASSVETLPQRRSDQGRNLFEQYVQRMVERKGDRRRYPLKPTVHWLSFLARQMRQQNQTIFSVELLQPDWLPKQYQSMYHQSLSIFVAVLIGLNITLLVTFRLGLRIGLLGGMLAITIVRLAFREVIGKERRIALAEHITWSWIRAGKGFFVGLGAEPLLLSFVGLLVRQDSGPVKDLSIGWFIVGIAYLVAGLLGLLLGGLAPSQSLERHTFSPGEGIRRSLWNGLFIGLLAGSLTGLTAGLVAGPIPGLLIGLAALLVSGLFRGLLATIQHTLLRFWLRRAGCFPFQVGAFLEDARARHLLQRVGGAIASPIDSC